jgi:hypothetical protein
VSSCCHEVLDLRAVGSSKAIFRFDIPRGPVVAHAANIPIRSAVLQVAVNQVQGVEPLLLARGLEIDALAQTFTYYIVGGGRVRNVNGAMKLYLVEKTWVPYPHGLCRRLAERLRGGSRVPVGISLRRTDFKSMLHST